MKRLTHRHASGGAAACLAATLFLGASYAAAQPGPAAPAKAPDVKPVKAAPPAAAPPAAAPPAAAPPAAAPPAATATAGAQPAAAPPAQPAAAQPTTEKAPAEKPAPVDLPSAKPAPEKPVAPAAAEHAAPPEGKEAPSDANVAGEEKEGEEKEGEEKAAEGPKEHWYDSLDVSAFIDSYFSLNTNLPKPQGGTNLLHANDPNNGFSVAQVGLNAVYEADPVGGTIYLRFGPQAISYAGGDLTGYGLEYLRQGFVTWKPMETLAIDLGKWDTFIGAEGLDSQDNFNYTRGLVHWLAQPTFHTGLRATYSPIDQLAVTAFAANGWNHTIDNNIGKTFGVQLKATPVDAFFANLGYVVGPEQDDTFTITNADGSTETRSLGSANKRMKHVIDLVVGYNPSDALNLLLNADVGLEQVPLDDGTENTQTVKWFGVALAGKYAVNDYFGAAARFEFYKDPNGYTTGFTDLDTGEAADVTLVSGTLTLQATPSPHLIIKLDGRVDYANGDYFQQAAGFAPTGASAADDNRTKLQPTITLGVVAKTN